MSLTTQQIHEKIEILPEQMQEETLDFINFLQNKLKNNVLEPKKTEPNGTRLADLMAEASAKELFSHIEDPAAWQREIRKDRSLPNRGD